VKSDKITRLRNEIESIKNEIEKLQGFRPTTHTKKFLRQLIGERMNIQNQIRKLDSTKKSKEAEKQSRRNNANQNRSHKMRRTWNYFRAIAKNYPVNLSIKQLRSEFSKFRKGLETDVSEIIWRNPSP
jgi:hypothetical protein